MFINTIEKINDFIISKINFQNNDCLLIKSYYLLIAEETIESDSENYDFEVINYDEFLTQSDINFIIHQYEILLVSELEYYNKNFISAFSDNFHSYNTELSQKIYYESTLQHLKSSIAYFTELETNGDFCGDELNILQKTTMAEFRNFHSGIITSLTNDFEKYINPKTDVESLKTLFSLDFTFAENLYNEFTAYEIFLKPISKTDFFNIININYHGGNKLALKFKSLSEFYTLIQFLSNKFANKPMEFYQQIADRFIISTKNKKDIVLNAKKLSNGISDLKNNVASRVVKNGSDILNIVKNLNY